MALFTEQPGARPRWAARPRRGVFLALPPAPVVVVAPARVAPFTEQSGSRPRWASRRAGRFFTVAPAAVQLAPVPFLEQSSTRTRRLGQRRGQFFSVIPAPVVPGGTGPLIPAFTEPAGPRPTRFAALPRRGALFDIPLTGTAPTVQPVPVPFIEQAGSRKAALIARRGRFAGTPSPVRQLVPGAIGGRLAGPLPVRRGRFFTLGRPAPVLTPKRLATRRRIPALRGAGTFFVRPLAGAQPATTTVHVTATGSITTEPVAIGSATPRRLAAGAATPQQVATGLITRKVTATN